MKIYINNNLINSEVLPTDAPTLDETLETFNFVLKASENPLPYAPMQPVRVELENDNNDVINLVLISDSVNTYSLNPQLYKHTISCVQNTRELSKHLVRNSVFSQPANSIKKAKLNWTLLVDDTYGTYAQTASPLTTTLNLDSKEKIKSAKIRFNTYFAYTTDRVTTPLRSSWDSSLITQNDIISAFTSTTFTFYNRFLINYELNGVAQTPLTITPQDLGLTSFNFSGEFYCDKLTQIIKQGATNITLELASGVYPVKGVVSDVSDPDSTIPYAIFYVFNLEIIAETYYYTVYDVLNLLLERQKQEDDNYYKQPLFSLPTRLENEQLYDLLTNTIAPNFTFTQLTMYECVAEVFRLFDAIFTMDANGLLDIEYFNEVSKTPLDSPKFSGRNLAISEEKYTNGLVAYYQDARIEESFPANNTFANVRSQSLGVPTADDHYFITPHPIHSVRNAKMPVFLDISSNILDAAEIIMQNELPIDITERVINEDLWILLNTGDVASTTPSTDIRQLNTIYFSRGDNKIQCAFSVKSQWGYNQYSIMIMLRFACAEMFGYDTYYPFDPSNNRFKISKPNVGDAGFWRLFKLNVKYLATIDGRTQVESIVNKYPGETLVDQVNGAVDLNKMGLNMFGLSLKMGEPVLSATHQISKWEDRIKTGDIYSYQNSLWVANVCSYTFVGGYIQGKISFVKNFNSLALRTRLLREKRVSNISQELTMKSEDNYIEYVYYTTDTSDIEAGSEQTIAYDNDLLYDGITMSFGKRVVDEYKISMATLNINSEIYYLPSIRYGSGNMICFEFAYNSPMSAGNQTVYKTSSSWFGSNKYFTSAIKYTDDSGFLDTATIKMVSATDNLEFDSNFPVLTSFSTDLTDVMTLSNYKIYKQPNEIFALNYELAFIPYQKERDFIGSAFINDNFFVNGEFKDKKLYLYYSSTEKYDILDTEGIGTATEITNVSGVVGANYFTLVLQHENITDTILSWSICDENGKILFASNSSGGAAYTDRRRIFFLTRHTRLS